MNKRWEGIICVLLPAGGATAFTNYHIVFYARTKQLRVGPLVTGQLPSTWDMTSIVIMMQAEKSMVDFDDLV